jgi:hypothetical protein
MEKDWKADLLLIQKLMGSQRIGRKGQKNLAKKRWKDLFDSFLSENQNTKQRKGKETSGWNVVLCGRQEGCYLSTNKSKTSKKNKPKISFIQLKPKEKKKEDDTIQDRKLEERKTLYITRL